MQVISEEKQIFPCQTNHSSLDSRIAIDCNFKHRLFYSSNGNKNEDRWEKAEKKYLFFMNLKSLRYSRKCS